MSAHSVFDPRHGVFVRRTEMRALLVVLEMLVTRPERCEGLDALYVELKRLDLLDTYLALKHACRSDES